MKKLLLITLTIIINQCLFAQVGNDSFKKGNECFDKKDYKGAVSAYNEAISKNPKNEDYFYKRGLALNKLSKTQAAYEDFCAGIKINNFSSKLFVERALILHNAKMIDEALSDYTMAINYAKVDSIKRVCLNNRGTIRHLKLDHQGAYEDYKKLFDMDSNNVETLNNLSTVLDDLNRKEEAQNLLKKIIKIDSTFAGAYLNLAFQLSKAGNYKEAAPYFETCVKLAPKQAFNYCNRGYNKLKLGDIEGALKDINYSIKLDATNSWAFKNRGLAYLEQGKKDKACYEFKKAIELHYTEQYGTEVQELINKNCGVGK
jgi:tetratricopeptide (TPR) repeat protein